MNADLHSVIIEHLEAVSAALRHVPRSSATDTVVDLLLEMFVDGDPRRGLLGPCVASEIVGGFFDGLSWPCPPETVCGEVLDLLVRASPLFDKADSEYTMVFGVRAAKSIADELRHLRTAEAVQARFVHARTKPPPPNHPWRSRRPGGGRFPT